MKIQENLQSIYENIESIKAKYGIKDEIKLLAVSKTHPQELIRDAYKAGQRLFGENRIQECQIKIPSLHDLDIEWHMVGHVQRNKAKIVASLFNWVDSIDKVETAHTLNNKLLEINKKINILLEVNTTGETSKNGCDPEEINQLIDSIIPLTQLTIRGFLTIGPLYSDTRSIQQSFYTLKQIYDKTQQSYKELPIDILSMGMSGDYDIAIKEGSNLIRLGTILFGQRNYAK